MQPRCHPTSRRAGAGARPRLGADPLQDDLDDPSSVLLCGIDAAVQGLAARPIQCVLDSLPHADPSSLRADLGPLARSQKPIRLTYRCHSSAQSSSRPRGWLQKTRLARRAAVHERASFPSPSVPATRSELTPLGSLAGLFLLRPPCDDALQMRASQAGRESRVGCERLGEDDGRQDSGRRTGRRLPVCVLSRSHDPRRTQLSREDGSFVVVAASDREG